MIDLNELKEQVYETAKSHGFHGEEYSDEHWLMMTITELSEAVEAHRKGNRASSYDYRGMSGGFSKWRFESAIKDSVEDELADSVIRLLDFAGVKNYTIEYSEENTEVHLQLIDWFSNRSFTEGIFVIITLLSQEEEAISLIDNAIASIFALAYSMNIDLPFFIQEKMKYNKSREYKHGKKY